MTRFRNVSNLELQAPVIILTVVSYLSLVVGSIQDTAFFLLKKYEKLLQKLLSFFQQKYQCIWL